MLHQKSIFLFFLQPFLFLMLYLIFFIGCQGDSAGKNIVPVVVDFVEEDIDGDGILYDTVNCSLLIETSKYQEAEITVNRDEEPSEETENEESSSIYCVDNCPDVANTEQIDIDKDGIGDSCEIPEEVIIIEDADEDGIVDESDNCVSVSNTDQTDSDQDGIGDSCEIPEEVIIIEDADGDGIADALDNCISVSNIDQTDADVDLIGDACDTEWNRATVDISWTVAQIPSTYAGSEGIAVHISWPTYTYGARYAEGAPIVVSVEGGAKANTLPTPGTPGFAELGFIDISFMMPGGGTSGSYKSGGVYDYRGFNCRGALADVINFVQGEIGGVEQNDSSDTKYLSEIIGYPILTDNIGIMAKSNGGNLATVTLDLHGNDTIGVKWYIGYETPVMDQFINAELGTDVNENPHYVRKSCGKTGCTVDYANITLSTKQTFNDKDGDNDTLDVEMVYFDDCDTSPCTTDYDEDYDFPVEPFVAMMNPSSELKAFYSYNLTKALEDLEILPFSTAIASSIDAQAFWKSRQALGHWDNAIGLNPSLKVMILSTVKDHVQATFDHPHIKMELDGWLTEGAGFVRLNPDSAYITQVGGSTLIDNPANTTTAKLWPEATSEDSAATWINNMSKILEPESLFVTTIFIAAVEEMADRTQTNNWSFNLDKTIAY